MMVRIVIFLPTICNMLLRVIDDHATIIRINNNTTHKVTCITPIILAIVTISTTGNSISILAVCITMDLYGFVLSLNISAEFTLQCLLYFVLKSLCRWCRSKSVICSTLWICRILTILRQKCFFLNHGNVYITLSADICIVCIGALYE